MSERGEEAIARAISEGLREISNITIMRRCEHYWDEIKSNISLGSMTHTQECIHCHKVRRI